ncbi:hypothetical protein PUN28_010707 [Cardiocondyla obscurior]|uniref:Uncharacterized protein n=1 Tax=Cardiocondyla obscurior TaxID=286306 RepID=A0AAW2FLU2_9HYME
MEHFFYKSRYHVVQAARGWPMMLNPVPHFHRWSSSLRHMLCRPQPIHLQFLQDLRRNQNTLNRSTRR